MWFRYVQDSEPNGAHEADALVGRTDALRLSWERSLAALDPQPAIDSARALLGQLQQADLGRLGPVGVARLGTSTRSTIGTLGEVLASVARLSHELELVEGDRLAPPYLVSLDGRVFVCDLSIPIGPGERVVLLYASVGG